MKRISFVGLDQDRAENPSLFRFRAKNTKARRVGAGSSRLHVGGTDFQELSSRFGRPPVSGPLSEAAGKSDFYLL